jgi:predicted small metal-binding protein
MIESGFPGSGVSLLAREGSRPMKSFRCGDVVAGCTRSFTGSEAEILTQVGLHAQADHGLTEIPDELVAQVRSAMVLVAA